jgi:hypothetical protein
MKDDDVLSRATRALRETGPTPEELRRTRARVLESAVRSKKKSRAWIWVLPIAAVLAATSVLAATGGLKAIAHKIVPEQAPPPVLTARATPLRMSPPPRPEPAPPPPPPAVVEPPPAPPAPPPSASAPKEDAGPNLDLAAYKTAHRLHFSSQDHAAALAAWDAYLRDFPRGTFALEARYNRAICLVKLGRTAEARAALQPFADGAMGGYRKDEARALLEALP